MDALPLAGCGRQSGKGGDVAGAGYANTLLFGKVEVVSGLRLEAGFQRFRVEVDPQQAGRLGLDGLALDESAPLEKGRPLVADEGIRLDAEHQPATGRRPPLQGVEHEQALAFGDRGTAGHVIRRPAGEDGGGALQRADPGTPGVEREALDLPAEA